MAKRKVLLTGASGYIASLMLPTMRDYFNLTLADVTDTDRDGNKVEGITPLNDVRVRRYTWFHKQDGGRLRYCRRLAFRQAG